MIDLRSDTVTQPTPEMLESMLSAPLGDDVLGDDPTVRALEERTAELLGMEAALYMPSGTMTNQVAIRTHTEPGDEILLDAEAHVYFYECGAPFALAGVSPRFVMADRGRFTPDDLRRAIRPRNQHYPPPKLVCVENTHNRGGGAVWSVQQVREICAAARELELATHLDGARLWNAAVAAGVPEDLYAREFDSVSVCFSKGLGAPVGSALAGSAAFIRRARRFRKMFGGGMRQAGIIAAGALYALEHHRDRLAEDHANARLLAEGICDFPGVEIIPTDVETNLVIFNIRSISAPALAKRLQSAGVLVLALGPDTIRAVTSLAVTTGNIHEAIEIFRATLTAV